MRLLSLTIDGKNIQAPSGVPTGGIGKVEEILQLAITLLLTFGVILTLFFIIYSGIQWITSGGDKEALQKAKKRLTYAIIGLIIILVSFFIINFIGVTFGVELIYIPPYLFMNKDRGAIP